MSAWYVTGDEAKDVVKKSHIKQLQREKERKEQQALPRNYRFWMPPSYVDDNKNYIKSTALVTFVDSIEHPNKYEMPFVFMEHNLLLNGHWKNWFTCLKTNCPLCQSGNNPYLAAAFTVVDHRKWTDRKGNLHEHESKLYVVKSSALTDMLDEFDRKGGVRGWRVEIIREGEKSHAVGSKRNFIKQVKVPERYQPIDYGLALAPKSEENLRSILGDILIEGAPSIKY